MPLNFNDIIPEDAIRNLDSDTFTVRGLTYALEANPYCESNTTYFMPRETTPAVIDNCSGTIITYTGVQPEALRVQINTLIRDFERELYGLDGIKSIPIQPEYSVITMGSEGAYLPIRFDEEYV